MATVNATEARLSEHEAVCAFRYETINARLKRMEQIMIGSAGAMIMALAGAVFALITHIK
jgi:hypothetical protein